MYTYNKLMKVNASKMVTSKGMPFILWAFEVHLFEELHRITNIGRYIFPVCQFNVTHIMTLCHPKSVNYASL